MIVYYLFKEQYYLCLNTLMMKKITFEKNIFSKMISDINKIIQLNKYFLSKINFSVMLRLIFVFVRSRSLHICNNISKNLTTSSSKKVRDISISRLQIGEFNCQCDFFIFVCVSYCESTSKYDVFKSKIFVDIRYFLASFLANIPNSSFHKSHRLWINLDTSSSNLHGHIGKPFYKYYW